MANAIHVWVNEF